MKERQVTGKTVRAPVEEAAPLLVPTEWDASGIPEDSALRALLDELGWEAVRDRRTQVLYAINKDGHKVVNYSIDRGGFWLVHSDHPGSFGLFEDAIRFAHKSRPRLSAEDLQLIEEASERLHEKRERRFQDSRTHDPAFTDMRLVVESLAELNATLRQVLAAPAPVVVGAGVTEDQIRTILEAGEVRLMERVHALLDAESTLRPVQAGPSLPDPSAHGGWWNLEGVDMVGSVRVATLNKKVAAGVLVLTLVEAPGQPVSNSVEFVPGGDTKGGKIVCAK